MFFSDMHAAKNLPEISSMEEGRKNKEHYTLFCSRFLPGVIGNAPFKAGCCTMKQTDYCSASDEAMTFLILANNWEPWSKMAELKKHDPKARLEDCGVKQIYFKDTKGRGHSWSNEGKLYYNDMYDKILEDRNDNGHSFNEHFLEYMKLNSDEGRRLDKHKKRPTVEAPAIIKCRRDVPPLMDGAMFSNDEYSNKENGSKKQRFEQTDEEIAIEQARQVGATSHLSL
jgi:hypothetical protein